MTPIFLFVFQLSHIWFIGAHFIILGLTICLSFIRGKMRGGIG